MRVLHVTPRFLPAYGGAEDLLGQISSRLAAEGHQVTVVTTDADNVQALWNPAGSRFRLHEEVIQAIRILRFPLRHLPGAPLSYSGVRRLLWMMSQNRSVPVDRLHRLARYTPWLPGLDRWLQETTEQFDIVMAMNICFESLVESAARFAKARGIPFVCLPLTHLGAEAIPGNDTLSRYYTMRHQLELVSQSHLVLTMTPSESLFYQAQGIAADKTVVLGSAVDPQQLSGGDGRRFRAGHQLQGPIVFSIGTLCYDKGTPHTVEAMRTLWRNGSTAVLVLAGAMMPDVAGLLARLQPDEKRQVLVLGSVSEQEKRDLLSAGDLMVMPSRTESFGSVYLEAWYYGKPVVGARTWGVQDVISDGVDGRLVPFGSVEQLAHVIQELVSEPQISEQLGEAGRVKTERYTWDSLYPVLRDAYQAALVNGRGHASGS